jgi:hypothetical protein
MNQPDIPIPDPAGEPAPGACFVKRGEYVSRLIAGEMILVPVRGQVGDLNAIYNLNEVAAFIWDRIDGAAGLRAIAAAVASEFDVTPAEAARDTHDFFASLIQAGLVEPAS